MNPIANMLVLGVWCAVGLAMRVPAPSVGSYVVCCLVYQVVLNALGFSTEKPLFTPKGFAFIVVGVPMLLGAAFQ